VHEQVKSLIKLGVDVTVAAPVPYSFFPLSLFKTKWKYLRKVPKEEVLEDVRIIHNRYIALPKGYFKYLWSYPYVHTLKKNINVNDFDLIHAHGALPDDFSAYLLSKKYKKPYVLTVHGATVYFAIKYPRQFKVNLKAVKNAAAVVGVSSKVVERIERYTGRKENISAILNGFNPITLPPKKETEKIKILFGATIIERKGLAYLLKAYQKIASEFHNVVLEIAGGGMLLNQMKEYALKLNLSDKVKFHGVVKHKRMLELMNECDVFILPSWDEAFGVVYLEAMSLGKAVIGSLGEGIEDVIEHNQNGLLVKTKDVDSIYNNLKLLIRDGDLRKRLGVSGQKSVGNLTWENNAKQYIELYEKVISLNGELK
jgi:glycosyltransferase involved in cell wall biosynthesis